MDFKKIKHIHFTGIKGVGMAALAIYAKEMGLGVTGSDVPEVFVTDEVLSKNDISFRLGFSEKNWEGKPDLVIATAAHGGLNNIEVVQAKKLKIKILTYAEALSEFAQGKKIIATSGVGGKTTTASMIATVLDYAQLSPSFVIGAGDIRPIGNPGHFNAKGKHFICEADEFAISPGVNDNPKFSLLSPHVCVVTNIEHDHPDIYPALSDTLKAFREFFSKVPKNGLLVACIDNPNVRKAIKNLKVPIATYGTSTNADWQIRNISFKNEKTHFSVFSKKQNLLRAEIGLNLPGVFNAQNALAAFVVGNFLGLSDGQIKLGLERFQGCRRRFEAMGQFKKVPFYDDYAHHPKEIIATLSAAREWFGDKRIIAVFQPHTYSRTKTLLADFSKAFKDADVVGFMDIYASARESKDESISSSLLTRKTKKYKSKVFYLGNHKNTLSWIRKNIKRNDLVLTMGAGDIFHIYADLNLEPIVEG